MGTHHGHAFSGTAELVEMIEAVPDVKCLAAADRQLNDRLGPEIWAVAMKGEAEPLPELRDRAFGRKWDSMVVPAGVRDGATESIFTIYRKELRRRIQILRPSVLEILAEPGLSSTVIFQRGDEAWRAPMAELPLWEKEVAGSFDAVLAAGTLDASDDPFAFTEFLENILSPQGILAVVGPGFHPAGEGKDASRGIRPTKEGLAFCFPGFWRIGLETFGPEGSPFVVAGVWSKDGGQEEFPEIDTALRVPFALNQDLVIELYGKPRPILEAFKMDFFRRMGPVVGGDVLFVSSARGNAGLSGCGLKTVRFLEKWPEAGRGVGGLYDTVISLGTLGESPDPRAAVEGFKEALRPGGALLFGEACLAPGGEDRTRPLLWRFTRPGLARLLKGFRHVRIELVGPSNGPLALYGWARA
jgi:hypothetical protein